MSKTRLVSSMAAALGVLLAACWLATATFPLLAAPQVTGAEFQGSILPVWAPPNIHLSEQKTVIVEAKVDAAGNVVDAQVIVGPDELRKVALQSVLTAHRIPSGAERTDVIEVVFEPESGPVKEIDILGVSDQTRADLLARLPVHEGDLVGPQDLAQVIPVARSFGLGVVFLRPMPDGARALMIGTAPTHIKIGGNAQAVKVLIKPAPVYPPLAKQAGIEGVVKLQAFIGKDGAIENLSIISGHPLLVPSALEAVRQWVYQPTLLNGEPVGVETEIDVNYTLAK